MPLKSKYLSYLSIALIAFGALARLRLYFDNRSLGSDEASLAINIVNRTYFELLNSLDYNQAAPPLYLWIEKFAVQVLGNNEYALRLFPLVASLVSLWLFYRLVTRFTTSMAVPIASAFFATLRYIVYYSIEVKPYIIDLTIGLLLFLVLGSLLTKTLSWRSIIMLSLLGTVCIWLSYPSVFILSGVELVGWFRHGASKFKAIFLNRLPIYLTWLVNFGLLYAFNVKPTMNNDNLVDSWSARYLSSPFNILDLLNELGKFFHKPLGFVGFSDGIAIFVFICGCIVLSRRHKFHLLLLNAPMLMTLLATYLHKYPFRERLILFLTPFSLIMIADGLAFFLTIKKQQYLKFLGFLVALLLFFSPVMRTLRVIANPSSFQFDQIHPTIEYFQAHGQPSDILYVFSKSWTSFQYYAQKYNIPPQNYIVGQLKRPKKKEEMSAEKWQEYQQEINQFRERARMWFLSVGSSSQEIALLLQQLDQIGTQLDVFQQPDVVICLYNLTK